LFRLRETAPREPGSDDFEHRLAALALTLERALAPPPADAG